MVVRFAKIPAHSIFNACDPALLFNVAEWFREKWWDTKYDDLRVLLRDTFIDEFDKVTGHYTKLRESIARHGIQNPVVVTAGNALWREPWMVPPDVGNYICESCGGSRLMIAQEMGLDVPCILNDTIGVTGEILHGTSDVANRFSDKSYQISFGPPTRVSPIKFSHMPEKYTFGVQQECRRQAKKKQIAAAKDWLKRNGQNMK